MQGIEEAFSASDDDGFGKEYLRYLIESEQKNADALRRTVVQMAVLAAAFILLAGAQTARFTVGPLTLTNVSGVLILLPPAIAVLSFDFVSALSVALQFEAVRALLIRHLHPKLSAEHLSAMLGPVALQAWGVENWQEIRRLQPSTMTKALSRANNVVGVAIFLGLICFFVFSYWHLFNAPHADLLLVIPSLVFCALNMGRVLLLFFTEVHPPDEWGVSSS
jgi:hypothetical protein